MKIELNGEPHEVSDGTTAAQLTEQLGLNGKRFAMEVNREILPRGQHASYQLQAGDKVEIVHAIGGG